MNLYQTAVGLLAERKYEEALRYFKIIEEDQICPVKLNYYAGLTYANLNEDAEAAECFLKVISEKGNFSAEEKYIANMVLGYIYSKADEISDAEHYFKQALELNEHSASPYEALAYIYFKNEHYQKAADTVKEGIKLFPDNYNLYNTYANILHFGFKKTEEALLQAKKALKLKKISGAVYDTLAYLYYFLENYTKAKYYIDRAYNLMPKNPEVEEHKNMIYGELNKNKN